MLIKAGGFLAITNTINTRGADATDDSQTADVRLVANGDITQSSAGTITADELGIRQQGTMITTPADQDVDGNGQLDILLGDANDVNVLAISNDFVGGVAQFNDCLLYTSPSPRD